MTETFSLKDLLKSNSPVSIFQEYGLFPNISIKWNVITNSDPIEDLMKWQRLVEQDHGLMFWDVRDFGLWQMSRGSGNNVFYETMQHMLFLRDRVTFSQVGPNLHKLKLKINRKALKKEKARKLRPQRDEWRRQERQRNKRLPGR